MVVDIPGAPLAIAMPQEMSEEQKQALTGAVALYTQAASWEIMAMVALLATAMPQERSQQPGTRSFSSSSIVRTGGLVGKSYGTIRNSCFDKTTTGQSGTRSGVAAFITAELQGLTATSTRWNVFNWDFGTPVNTLPCGATKPMEAIHPCK